MASIDTILNFIASEVQSAGVDKLVIGDLPSLQENCVAIRPIDGYPSTFYFGQKCTDEPLIEVVVRNELYETGQLYYTVIREALNMRNNPDIGLDALFITGSPGFLGTNEYGYKEWHLLFHATILKGEN